MHLFKHLRTITRHHNKVMKYCFKCGLYKQGLFHDFSKLSRTEFFNGARFYLGTKSPHYAERQKKGYSEAWMHHKGRNKHHIEYWVDINMDTHKYEPVDMPNRYLAESICDRIAATEIYNGKNVKKEDALNYFYKEGKYLEMSQLTRERMEYLLKYYVIKGPKELFKFIKKNMRNLDTQIPMEVLDEGIIKE
ncbi:hypothetical protein EI71_00940 [Anaeroplasma bactoclasticum]|uniref:Catalase n=1 Tax=Anaeroplasma bactoclasticum TaxID=2088 RepID=A0A397RYZ8_9MOLU|nr:DUF5662 family protein [Anaeroplasma bactoclasticum]RIA77786.1 hypothetical protein EI71_00940 [Anaeroplasma bactoclasticum]